MRYLVLIIAALIPSVSFGQEFKILSWNVESGGSDPVVIRRQLELMRDTFDILALTEVSSGLTSDVTILGELGGATKNSFTIGSSTGGDDRMLISIDQKKFMIERYLDLEEFNGVSLGDKRERAPQIVTLFHIESQKLFHVINNHFSSDQQKRNQQAKALVEWTRSQTLPVIAVGQYNMDYDFRTQKGNEAFSIIQRDGIFKWVKPTELIDTNWADRNKDGKDDFPDSMLDFVFTAGPAKDWDVSTKIIVREGDFPDDEKTSDHRPTLTTVKLK